MLVKRASSNLWGLLTTFVAGVAVGVLATVWYGGSRHPDSGVSARITEAPESALFPPESEHISRAGPRPPGPELDPPNDVRDAVLVVSVLDALGRETARVLSARLGAEGVLVLPLAALRGAASVTARDRFGREYPVQGVVAFDFESGLVALGARAAGAPALAVSREDHPLYLGREVQLLTSSRVASGWVDGSSMERLDSPSPLMPVRLSRERASDTGVLLAPEQQTAVGILYPVSDPEAMPGALQADSLRVLLSQVQRGERWPLGSVLERYFTEVPAGMWQQLGYQRSRGDWEAVMTLGARLMDVSARHGEALRPLLESVAIERARAHLADGEYTRALRWLERGAALLGDTPAMLAAAASTATAMGDFAAARNYVTQVLQYGNAADSAVQQDLRKTVMAQAQVLRKRGATDELIALLTEVVLLDPTYGRYHAYLGEAHLARREYGLALDHLSRAAELDSSLAARLAPAIQRAQVKVSVPDLTEVPYLRSAGGIRVGVRLNGTGDIYRFVLDTGASQTVVVRPVAEQLGIEVNGATPRVRVRTASDEVVAPLVTLRSVDLGGAVVPGVKALIMEDLGGPDGLLGLSYLSYFDVSIEQDAGILSLRRK